MGSMKAPPFEMKYNARQREALDILNTRIEDAKRRLAAPRKIIDFETRCAIDLKQVGAYKYSQHKSCEVLMMSYNLTGKPGDTKLWVKGDRPPQGLFAMLKSGAILGAFNSYFEFCIWKHVCVARMGWPDIELEDIIDVADKCKALALPANLAEAGEVLKLDMPKDTEGKALINLFCKPKKDGTYNDEHSHPAEWQRFCNYAIRDTDAELEIDLLLPDLLPIEQLVAWLTNRINWRGVYVDQAAIRGADKLAGAVKVQYNAEASKLSGGMFLKCTQRAKVKEWLKLQGIVMPNMQGKTITKWLRKDLKPHVRRMLELYTVAGSSSVAKFSSMLNYVCDDGRVHELLNYHKARTGRWGGKGIQIQNFPRPVLPKGTDYEEVLRMLKRGSVAELEAYARKLEAMDKKQRTAKGKTTWWTFNVMQVLTSSIRSVICAMFGNHFKSADYSAIEARFLVWEAGDERALQLFRDGVDVYLDMAAAIYGVPLHTLDKESDERPLGKETILGAGYGMGHEKFQTRCDEVANIQIDIAMAKKSINAYRTKYESVAGKNGLWKQLERASVEAVQHPGRVTEYRGFKYRVTKYGKMPILECRFPSGRKTGYPYPRVVEIDKWGNGNLQYELRYQGYDSKTHKWVELSTYGGKLVENNTQGGSRDLMAFGMLLLDCVGYFLIMTVHDEAASEDEDGFGSLEDFELLLCTLPRWAWGLPVTSEGWQGPRYRK
jgi:DNA polymerase